MAESNLKDMMIDDINEDADEENQIVDSQPKLKWYLIDSERTFCKFWNFLITWVIIYSLFATPVWFAFPHLLSCSLGETLVDPGRRPEEVDCVESDSSENL